RLVGPVLRDAAQGADTAVWLTATRDHIGSGGFWHDRRRRATHYASVRRETPDEVERFWRWVRDITGVPSPS
ncbi:MAG: dehydrogenase/reductase, partial [Humibacillus sp.]|nr:dehydrogenase/reductase [Humibacillus sp.]